MLSWDPSHDYVLQRFWNDVTHLTIRFRQSPPSANDLAALRRALPQFRDTAPASVREMIGDSRELSLGEMPSHEARLVIEAALAQGLDVVAEARSFASYMPFDRTTGCAWLIEDAREAAAVAEAMLAAGIPVQNIET